MHTCSSGQATYTYLQLFMSYLLLSCSVLFSPFSIAITSLGEERAYLSAFRTFVRFALVWFCLFPLPLGVWEGLWFVIVALPGLFSYLFSLVNLMTKSIKWHVRPAKTQISLGIRLV